MFIPKQMRTALLISFFWHFLLFSCVCVIFLPINLNTRQYSRTNFLGSILRQTELIGPASPAAKSFTVLPPEAQIQNRSHPDNIDVTLPVEKEALDFDKIVNIDSLARGLPFAVTFCSSQTKKPQSKLLYQPPYPVLPEWQAQQPQADFTIFKVYILACGLVQQVITVYSSGNPELDAALARYVRKWRFAPMFEEEGQWQMVKVAPPGL